MNIVYFVNVLISHFLCSVLVDALGVPVLNVGTGKYAGQSFPIFIGKAAFKKGSGGFVIPLDGEPDDTPIVWTGSKKELERQVVVAGLDGVPLLEHLRNIMNPVLDSEESGAFDLLWGVISSTEVDHVSKSGEKTRRILDKRSFKTLANTRASIARVFHEVKNRSLKEAVVLKEALADYSAEQFFEDLHNGGESDNTPSPETVDDLELF